MRIALTGTPGAGKTTLAELARRDGWAVVDVRQWAHQADAVAGYDEQDGAYAIDVEALARAPIPGAPARVILDGHLSHLLPADVVWVVRADPLLLGRRLAARRYPIAKVRENQEAEALDIILQEALDQGVPVVQRDGTRRTPLQLWKSFAETLAHPLKAHDLEAVDWSHRLPL